MNKLIIALICSLSYVNAATYSSFVSNNLQILHKEIFDEARGVDRETVPQEVKQLRKKIGLYKIYLDLGIFLYPERDKVRWKKLRSDIDEGYEVYGNFKDLYDTADLIDDSINREITEKLCNKVLEWNTVAFESSSKWERFLSQPLSYGALKVRKKDLPKFLWRQIDFRPKAQDSATQVLVTLTDQVFEKAAKDYQKFVKIKNLLKDKDEVFFHDFRKLVRTSLKLVVELQEVETMTNKYSKEILLELIKRIGDINDVLVAYHKTNKKSLAKEVGSKWKALKNWVKDNDIKSHLKEII